MYLKLQTVLFCSLRSALYIISFATCDKENEPLMDYAVGYTDLQPKLFSRRQCIILGIQLQCVGSFDIPSTLYDE